MKAVKQLLKRKTVKVPRHHLDSSKFLVCNFFHYVLTFFYHNLYNKEPSLEDIFSISKDFNGKQPIFRCDIVHPGITFGDSGCVPLFFSKIVCNHGLDLLESWDYAICKPFLFLMIHPQGLMVPHVLTLKAVIIPRRCVHRLYDLLLTISCLSSFH